MNYHYLTHYYHKDDQPFKSLSELSVTEALDVIQRFDCNECLVYRRFKNPQKYIEDRHRCENWIRQEFIQLGGKPQSTFPHYLVLGNAPYIEKGYNNNCNSLQIPLKAIIPETVSFTYPDSMVSLWLKEQKRPEYNSRYHGKVYTLSGIQNLLKSVPHQANLWEKDPKRPYDFFIEAQLWVSSPLDLLR